VETAVGLRPELVSQGLGRGVIAAGLAFGRRTFSPAAFCVTVASSNARALRRVKSLGFVARGRSAATRDGRPFHVLARRPAG
jgi:hypothetical protein